MNIPVYHVDAFSDHLFAGNPAMVCILERWLPDALLHKIAAENNLPATVFLLKSGDDFATRWFSPEHEIDLCGHGSLAAGQVIFNELCPDLNETALRFRGGFAMLRRRDPFIEIDFPVKAIQPCAPSDILSRGLGQQPDEIYSHQNERCLAIFSDEEQIRQLVPDTNLLKQLEYRGIIVSAPGKTSDFVSRTFYPAKAIAEDAVTGSSHCLLVPYWSEKLNKTQLESHQLSSRGGELICKLAGNQVILCGKAVIYMTGNVSIDI